MEDPEAGILFHVKNPQNDDISSSVFGNLTAVSDIKYRIYTLGEEIL